MPPVNNKKLIEALTNGTYRPSVFVYGPPGSGKTYFLGSVKRIFIFDFDMGLKTLIGNDGWEGEDFPNLRSAATTVKFEALWDKIVKDPSFDAIGIDSMTTWSEAILYKIVSANGRKRPILPDYGDQVRAIRDLMYDVLEVHGKGLFVTAHERTFSVDDDSTEEPFLQFRPYVVGKDLPNQIGLFFDEFYYARSAGSVSRPTFELCTRATQHFLAKSRLSSFAHLSPREPNDWSGVIWPKMLKGMEELKQKGGAAVVESPKT